MKHRSASFPFWLCALCVFVVALALRAYWGMQKGALDMDEAFSVKVALSHRPFGAMPDSLVGRTLEGDEVRRIVFAPQNSTLSDLRQLYIDNGDHIHSNLYYLLLRLGMHGEQQGTLGSLLSRGLAINLIFFCIEFLLLIALLRECFGRSHLLTTAGLLATTCNTGAISVFLYLRSYAMQEMLFVALALIVARAAKRLWRGERPFSWWKLAGVGVVVGLSILETFTSAIFLALAALALVGIALRRGQWRFIVDLLFVGAIGVAFTLLVCPYFFGVLTDGHFSGAVEGFSLVRLLTRLAMNIWVVTKIALAHSLFLPVAAMVAAVVLCHWRRWTALPRTPLLLICLALVWQVAYCSVGVLIGMRYVQAAAPLLLLCVPLSLWLVRSVAWRKALCCAVVVSYALLPLTATDGPELPRLPMPQTQYVYPRNAQPFPVAEHYAVVHQENEWYLWPALHALPSGSTVSILSSAAELSGEPKGTILIAVKTDNELLGLASDYERLTVEWNNSITFLRK